MVWYYSFNKIHYNFLLVLRWQIHCRICLWEKRANESHGLRKYNGVKRQCPWFRFETLRWRNKARKLSWCQCREKCYGYQMLLHGGLLQLEFKFAPSCSFDHDYRSNCYSHELQNFCLDLHRTMYCTFDFFCNCLFKCIVNRYLNVINLNKSLSNYLFPLNLLQLYI